MSMGKGKNFPAVHFHVGGIPVNIFTIWGNGKLSIDFGGWAKFVPKETRSEFYKKLKLIGAFSAIPEDLSKYPSIDIDTLANEDQLALFQQNIAWLATAIGTKGVIV